MRPNSSEDLREWGQLEHSDAAEMSNWTRTRMLFVATRNLGTSARADSVSWDAVGMEVELMSANDPAAVGGKRAGHELDLEAKQQRYFWLWEKG